MPSPVDNFGHNEKKQYKLNDNGFSWFMNGNCAKMDTKIFSDFQTFFMEGGPMSRLTAHRACVEESAFEIRHCFAE